MNKLFKVNIDFLYIAIIPLIAIFFSLDRYLKKIALSLPTGRSYELISDFFTFSFAKNYNIAFSLPLGEKILLPIIYLAIFLLIFAIIRDILINKAFTLEASLLTFILLGAISNMLDRIQLGFVIDYLSIKNFSIFNIADMMIALASLFYIILYYKMNKAKTRKNE